MEELLTINEVAEILKTDRHVVYNLVKNGTLKAIKIGSLKVRRSNVDELIRQFDGCKMI